MKSLITYPAELIKKTPSLIKKYKQIIKNHPNIFSAYKTWNIAAKDWKTTVPKLIDKVFNQLINHEYKVTYTRLQQLRKNGDIFAQILENDIRQYNEKHSGRVTKKRKNPKDLRIVKLIKDIIKEKNTLIKEAKEKGIYENFGQKEIRKLKDKYIDISKYTDEMNEMRLLILEFDQWCSHFDLSRLNPKHFWYKMNPSNKSKYHQINPPLSPKTLDTIYGWGKRKPNLVSERRSIAKRYGRECFIDKRGLRYPICNKQGHIDCDGLRAAYVRASQFHQKAGANEALRLAKRYGCVWTERHKENPTHRKTPGEIEIAKQVGKDIKTKLGMRSLDKFSKSKRKSGMLTARELKEFLDKKNPLLYEGIRSRGQGRFLGKGKGKGPIGVPIGRRNPILRARLGSYRGRGLRPITRLNPSYNEQDQLEYFWQDLPLELQNTIFGRFVETIKKIDKVGDNIAIETADDYINKNNYPKSLSDWELIVDEYE